MNPEIAEIRRRAVDGYHLCRVTQGLEDVIDLLRVVDVVVANHLTCTEMRQAGRRDCVKHIAKELGVANPATAK